MTAKVLGVGLHQFGRWPEKSAAEMAFEALNEAVSSGGVEAKDIDAIFCGSVLPSTGGGSAVAQLCGLAGAPVFNVNAACASSSVATVLAAIAIAAGQFETVLVLGFEKMQRGIIPTLRPHDPYGYYLGLTMQPVRYALKARRYLEKYGVPIEALASVAVKSRKHGASNPYAQFQVTVSLEEVLSSPLISDPLTRLQCSPTTDGASALVLGSPAKYASRKVNLAAWALRGASGEEHPDADVEEELTAQLARRVYETAGIGPEDVDVVQVHDAFTSGEVIRTEALGLCPKGEGAYWCQRGETSIGGRIPVNTDGGLLSRGHPLGATGVAQIAEAFRQLTGEAKARQIDPRPKVAVCQNYGGGETAADVVMLLTT